MKRTAVSFSLLLVLAMSAITGASNGSPTAPASHQINGVLAGTLTFVPFGPGFFDIDSLGESSGIVKSLGRANMFTFHRPSADGSAVTNGLVSIVAADGDIIRGHYVGTTVPGPEPNQLIGNADFVISGGTGRFAGASGTIHATVYVTVEGFDDFEWPATWVLEGTINY